jgi:hypothetical protein
VTKSGGLSARGRRAVGAQKVLKQSGLLADTLARQLIDGGHGVEVSTNLGISAEDRTRIIEILEDYLRR